MNRHDVNWVGPMPALTTPFRDDGSIDFAGLGANIERLIAAGSTGVVAGGCTGEFWALSHDERKQLYAAAVEAVAGKGVTIVGTGSINADEVIALSRHAKDVGADGVLILPPYFVNLSADQIFAHFRKISDAIDIPICVYNIPQCSTNAITPALAKRLASLDKVVAIKESAGDWNNFYHTLLAVKDDLRVFCGPSSVFGVPALNLGADGTIDCFPNVWQGGLDMYYAAKDGDTARCASIQETGRRLTDLFVSEGRTLYPATKEAMDMMGLPGGGKPRAPLMPLEPAQRAGLERGLRELGLL